MSAWIVSKTHIDALVHAGIDAEIIRPNEADDFGRMLWRENLASIHYRYPDTAEDGGYPGPIDFTPDQVETYTYEPLDGGPGASRDVPTVVYDTARCYAYQSSEHPEWKTSKARKFAESLQHLTASARGDGPWGTDDRNAFIIP